MKIKDSIKKFNFDYDNRDILNSLEKNSIHFRDGYDINGRFERTYFDYEIISEIGNIFEGAIKLGKEMTGESLYVPLKGIYGSNSSEYWFNIMKPGESTGWHDHKHQAALSCVYYLDIPKDSGDIKFRFQENNQWVYYKIKSKNTQLILFDRSIEHCVTENRSNKIRTSLSFNLFKKS